MKKLIMVLLATLLLFGCKKETLIPDPLVSISANPEQVNYNGTSVISWTSTNASYCTLNGARVNSSGSQTLVITESKNYSIIAFGEGGKTANDAVNITVILPPAPKLTITNIPTQPLRYWEDSISISYTTDNSVVDSTILNRVKVPNTGTITYKNMTKTTNDTLSAFGPGGVTTKIITIPIGDWRTSPQGFISSSGRAWKLKTQHMNDSLTNYQWFERFKFDAEELAQSYYFTLQGKKEVYDGNNVFLRSYDYQLFEENGSLKMKLANSEIYDVEILNEDYLVVITKVKFGINSSTGIFIDSYMKTTLIH